jgi:hypothetical protein
VSTDNIREKYGEAGMPRRNLATTEEFVVSGNEVKHVPTNATLFAYEGQEEISSYIVGHMGSVLPNGDDYEEDSIKRIAVKLMKERPSVKGEDDTARASVKEKLRQEAKKYRRTRREHR